MLLDPDWIDEIWIDAKSLAEKETGLDIGAYPENRPWPMANILSQDWLPA